MWQGAAGIRNFLMLMLLTILCFNLELTASRPQEGGQGQKPLKEKIPAPWRRAVRGTESPLLKNILILDPTGLAASARELIPSQWQGISLDFKAVSRELENLWKRGERAANPLTGGPDPTPHGPIMIAGTNSHHHFTAWAMERLVSQRPDSQGTTLVLFDRHSDSRKDAAPPDCGNWIPKYLQVSSIPLELVILGNTPRRSALTDHSSWYHFSPSPQSANSLFTAKACSLFFSQTPAFEDWCVRETLPDQLLGLKSGRGFHITFRNLANEQDIDLLIGALQGKSLYISVDLDVLKPELAHTDWGSGLLELDQLCRLIQELGEAGQIFGGDVTGCVRTLGSQPELPEINRHATGAIIHALTRAMEPQG